MFLCSCFKSLIVTSFCRNVNILQTIIFKTRFDRICRKFNLIYVKCDLILYHMVQTSNDPGKKII